MNPVTKEMGSRSLVSQQHIMGVTPLYSRRGRESRYVTNRSKTESWRTGPQLGIQTRQDLCSVCSSSDPKTTCENKKSNKKEKKYIKVIGLNQIEQEKIVSLYFNSKENRLF